MSPIRVTHSHGSYEVHVAVRLHADVVLGYAPATEEAGLTGIAGLGVDLHVTQSRKDPGER